MIELSDVEMLVIIPVPAPDPCIRTRRAHHRHRGASRKPEGDVGTRFPASFALFALSRCESRPRTSPAPKESDPGKGALGP